jgi:pimeloyl-ACP methyl ester carboxylesterase
LGRPYRLAAFERGKGSETVVLLHGVGASGKKWRTLAQLLDTKSWRVIVPDLLGFGKSPTPQWSDYSVQEHAKAVLKTLQKLRAGQPLTIVAHSMGCLIAAHIAASQPGLVKRLILYEPPLYADNPDFPAHMRRRQYYFALYEFIAAHPQLAVTQAQLMWRVAKRLVGLKLSEEQWIPFERSLRNTIMQQTAWRELHHIKIPTDIIHGRFDLIVTRTDLRKIFRANKWITWHKVSDVHGISARSARYIAWLLG